MDRVITWSRDNAWTVLIVVAIISAFFVKGALSIKIDASAEKMMKSDDPNKIFYQNVVKDFGSDNVTTVLVRDNDLFTYDKLLKLQNLFYEFEEMEGVTRVNSLFNVTNFKGEDGVLSTNILIDEDFPEDPNELHEVKLDALRNPLIVGRMLSKDGKVMAINIIAENESGDENFDARISEEIDKHLKTIEGDFEEVFQLGTPLIRRSIKDYILADQQSLIPLSMILLLTLLIFGLKSAHGALIPMVTGGISVLWTIGFMQYVGVPIQLLTVIVPTLLLILGATEDMHIISEYFEGIEEGKDKLGAIEYMGKKVGLAITLTAITTFLGFGSIIMNDLTMLQEFGIAASFGLFVNYFVTITVCPAYLKLFGEKKSPFNHDGEEEKSSIYHKIANVCVEFVRDRRPVIFWGCLSVALVCLYGIKFVKVDNDLLGNFKYNSPIREKSRTLQKDLAGSQSFYVILEASKKDAFKDPELLNRIVKIQKEIERSPAFDSSTSLADQISLIHREMNNGNDDFYRVPSSEKLIPQYLIMFSREDLDRFVTSDYKRANVIIRHSLTSSFEIKEALSDLEVQIQNILKGSGISYKFTSESILINDASDSIAEGQVYSIALLMLIIFIIMSLLFTNLKAGLLSLIPNIFPVIILFGVMGYFGIPLNTGTALIAAIAIGIAVDDTIHYMVRYNQEMKDCNNQIEAMKRSTTAEIRPVLTTSIALSLGFAILSVSNFIPLIHFGILTALVMMLALFCDLFVTPSLLVSTKLVTLWDLLSLKVSKDVMSNSPLFHNMKFRDIKKIILLGHTGSYKKGDYIITQGEVDRKMFLLLKGEVKVHFKDKNDKHHELGVLTPGEVFGEIALVDTVERTANIECLSDDVDVLEIDWKSLEIMRKVAPRRSAMLFLNISRILGKRLVAVNEKT